MSKARDLAGLFNLNPTSGTTAQRPATADVGDIYYNGTTGKTEIYTTTGWKEMASGIPFGNTAARPTAVTGQPYFNGETQRLELFTGTSWENIVQEVPGVSSISGVYSEQTNSGVITIYGTNFVNGAYATAIGTNGVQINASSTTFNSLVQLTATFTGLSNANEPYDIKVTNPSNLFGLIPDALYVNANPVWVTASGSLGTFNENVSISLSATATDETTVSYALASGSTLPSGVTLNSASGLISGILPNISSNTVYSFTVNATDGLNTTPRSFSITSNPLPEVSGGILTSDSTYYYRAFLSSGDLIVSGGSINADILMVGGGGAGGPSYGDNDTGKGGGGAGGVLTKLAHPITAGTYPITVGNGGAGRSRGTNSAPPAANSGQPTIAFGVQANGGGAGGGSDDYAGGAPAQGGSGGGAGARNSNSINFTGAVSNQASYSGWTKYGNSGESANNGNFGGGGGGGAGGAGQGQTGSSNDSIGGNGGVGYNFSSTFGTTYGASGWFGGGGGGGSYATASLKAQSVGGQGGGGNGVSAREYSQGGQVLNVNINGAANTGGGGGGSSEDAGIRENFGSQSGSGGSGIVIIRYLKSAASL